jgi:hypothetical protein
LLIRHSRILEFAWRSAANPFHVIRRYDTSQPPLYEHR